MAINRCSVFDRMPKNTLLAILGSKQVKLIPTNTVVSYTDDSGRTKNYKIVEDFGTTVKITDGTETLTIDKSKAITGNEIFLDKFDTWDINSFDSKRKEVCVAIKGKVNSSITYNVY